MTDTVTAASAAFTQSESPLPHGKRAKLILAAHPDVREQFKRDPSSALWTVLLVALQVAIGIGLAVFDAPWWTIIIAAYALGAFANHALFVLIHDYTHNVVFKTANANRLGSIFANIAIVFPAAIGFKAVVFMAKTPSQTDSQTDQIHERSTSVRISLDINLSRCERLAPGRNRGVRFPPAHRRDSPILRRGRRSALER